MRKLSFILLISLIVSLMGCASIQSEDLLKDKEPATVVGVHDLTEQSEVLTDFGARVFKESFTEEKNTLISPISILYALSMVANGAEGETLSQMEQAIGLPVNVLNNYLYSYENALPQGDKYKYHLANSIWFRDDKALTVNDDFLQINVDYYDSEIYKSAFDAGTVKDINQWVKQNTDGMIPGIIEEIPESAILYLINALAFEAEWDVKYEKKQVREDEFHHPDGIKEVVDFMFSSEAIYLEDENTTGFMKYYKDQSYAFVALLPKPGIRMEEYVDSLDGAKIQTLLRERIYTEVKTAIPVFEAEFGTELTEVLSNMGMEDVFDMVNADLTGMGTYEGQNIYIGKVIHKTYISVDEQGTKAAAVTGAAANCAGVPEEPKKVYLERPFVYMLIDCKTNIPFFIGTTMTIQE